MQLAELSKLFLNISFLNTYQGKVITQYRCGVEYFNRSERKQLGNNNERTPNDVSPFTLSSQKY